MGSISPFLILVLNHVMPLQWDLCILPWNLIIHPSHIVALFNGDNWNYSEMTSYGESLYVYAALRFSYERVRHCSVCDQMYYLKHFEHWYYEYYQILSSLPLQCQIFLKEKYTFCLNQNVNKSLNSPRSRDPSIFGNQVCLLMILSIKCWFLQNIPRFKFWNEIRLFEVNT